MLRWALIIALTCGSAACVPAPDSCENPVDCALGPRVVSKLDSGIIGKTRAEAVALAGTPSNTYTSAEGVQTLTWRHERTVPNFGLITCTETVTIQNGAVTAYDRGGDCKTPS